PRAKFTAATKCSRGVRTILAAKQATFRTNSSNRSGNFSAASEVRDRLNSTLGVGRSAFGVFGLWGEANVERPTPNIQCRTQKKNERVKGIEPSCVAWEATVLPLNYTRDR